MFEDDYEQDGNQPNNDAGAQPRYGSMFRLPQASGTGDGDFVNRNFGLRVDPNTGITYPARLAAVLGKDAPGQNVTAQDASGQAAPGQGPGYLPPIQTRDAQGKTLPKYHMGIGHRILASVANFANGFAGNGAAPIYMGPGALSNRYYQDEASRQQVNTENATLQRDASRYWNTIDWRTIEQDPKTKKYFGLTYGGQRQQIETPPWAGADDEDNGTNNNDAPETTAPVGREAGPAPISGRPRSAARQRFAEIQRRKSYR